MCHCPFIPTRKYLACVSNMLLFHLFKLLFKTASSVQLCTSQSACKQWQWTCYTHRCNKCKRLAILVIHLTLLTTCIETDRTATLRCHCAVATTESIGLAIVQRGQSLSLQTLQTLPATQTVTITTSSWL
jgi:hypothetical protein